MKSANRTILIVGMGMAPAVLAEMVLALILKVKGSRKDEIDFRN